MKERVDLNNNGLCIESSGKILKKSKWVNRYIVCKKPSDVNSPILMIFKSKKDRQMNNLKMSLVLQNYVGFESGFELYRSCNTLALITKEDIVIFSFILAETLVLWETWLKAICGSSSYFFMQLQRAPSRPEFAPLLFKEVRCHLHDCRLAVVHGRPHKLMLYCDIISAEINVAENNIITIRPSTAKINDSFTFLCPRSATFKTLLTKAMNEKGLHRYLSKHQTEGDWMPEFIIPYNKPTDSESQFSQTFSGLFNFFTTIESPKQFKKPNLDKEKSKSGLHFGNGVVHKQLTNLARTNSLAIYYNTTRRDAKDESIGNYVNVSRHGSPLSEREMITTPISRKTSRLEASRPAYCNYHNQQSIVEVNSLSASLPNYVNVQFAANTPQKGSIGESCSSTVIPQRPIINMGRIRRRSDISLANAMERPSTSKGRSMGDFTSARFDSESRYENWKKAKKFISAFKPKSQSDLQHKNRPNLRSLTKSSSTGALQFAPAVAYCSGHISSGSLSEFDEPPPSLDFAVSEKMPMQMKENDEAPPEGLVRPKEEILIKARAGVGAILARRLASSIRGSFSKYDGERATHHYQADGPLEIPKAASPPMIEALDGIEAAVNRGQDRLKESDRRASNVSFHKVVQLPHKSHKPKKGSITVTQRSLLPHLTSPRNSTSCSENTRSSNESLSSDARSRISIRKRNTSPPRIPAPILILRQSSSHTLLQNPSSSVDSLNSEQTARSDSPPQLPQRVANNSGSSSNSFQSDTSAHTTRLVNYCAITTPPVAPSSSSSNSVNSRVEYVLIDPVTTKAAKEAVCMHLSPFERSRMISSSMNGMSTLRRKSQGQSSTSDSVSLGQPTRQGFFRKYRKMRRNKKTAASMSQLNV